MTDAELIADVEARYPDLDTAGFPGDRRNGPYPKLSADHCGFAIARAFLEAGAPGGRRHRDGYYSYGLKHAAEDWAMAKGTPDYVGNGAMIGAAVASGWSVRRDSINAWLKPPERIDPRNDGLMRGGSDQGEPTMGVDIYLTSIYGPFAANQDNFRPVAAGDPVRDINAMFDRMRSSGGYFRNGYNSGDVMWAMGLSWVSDVGPMLDEGHCLPIERARELVALIEARPLTHERLGKVYLEELTNGVEPHPISRMLDEACGNGPKDPPDFEAWARFVRERRAQLLALLQKSIELGEPLCCSL